MRSRSAARRLAMMKSCTQCRRQKMRFKPTVQMHLAAVTSRGCDVVVKLTLWSHLAGAYRLLQQQVRLPARLHLRPHLRLLPPRPAGHPPLLQLPPPPQLPPLHPRLQPLHPPLPPRQARDPTLLQPFTMAPVGPSAVDICFMLFGEFYSMHSLKCWRNLILHFRKLMHQMHNCVRIWCTVQDKSIIVTW